jgi:hypothetical protein
VGESWLQGVTAPVQLAPLVSQLHPLCVAHVVSLSEPHGVIVPVQGVKLDQLQPSSPPQVVSFVICVHGVTVPVQLVELNAQPGSLLHVVLVRLLHNATTGVQVPDVLVVPVQMQPLGYSSQSNSSLT